MKVWRRASVTLMRAIATTIDRTQRRVTEPAETNKDNSDGENQ
jgi:hypothetical protein